MTINVEQYWIEVKNDGDPSELSDEGKWVAYPKVDYGGDKALRLKVLIEKVNRIVEGFCLKVALISRNHLDIIIFFTSADRTEIWKVKQAIKSELRIGDDSLIWKPSFETDRDWEFNKGNLWLLSEIMDAFYSKEYHLRSGWHRKAERIEEKRVIPLLTKLRRRLVENSMENRKSMIVKPSFPSIDYEIDPNLVFILMPFTETWSDDVYHLIKQAGEGLKLKVMRADDIFDPEIIVNDVWRMINKAGLIIADISVHNANVFYELGIAHTVGKRVILIRQEGGEKAPFDIAFWRYIDYNTSPLKAEKFKQTLLKVLEKHIASFQM